MKKVVINDISRMWDTAMYDMNGNSLLETESGRFTDYQYFTNGCIADLKEDEDVYGAFVTLYMNIGDDDGNPVRIQSQDFYDDEDWGFFEEVIQ